MAEIDINSIKQRFGIIGNVPSILHDIRIAVQVAQTDLSVLITGESGVGKEHFPRIIHAYSVRKHGNYFAVNCGAIPEGTIDSELFGHEKGAFTDAKAERKGYFEIANGGTLFLDEVGELPLSTQVRLLRVLETGEFIKMGSSQVQKTDVRVVAATNLNMRDAIAKGKFREDLYYRLNTVEIKVPPLRERKEDIPFLFRKFAQDFANKYQMPPIHLTDEALALLQNYYWYGNVRQLKNVTEQLSVLETNHNIDATTLKKYLPDMANQSNALIALSSPSAKADLLNDPEVLYKILLDMKKDMSLMRMQIDNLLQQQPSKPEYSIVSAPIQSIHSPENDSKKDFYEEAEEVKEEEKLQSMQDLEKEHLERVLQKHNGNRKAAAQELKMAERTLYRRIKEYGL